MVTSERKIRDSLGSDILYPFQSYIQDPTSGMNVSVVGENSLRVIAQPYEYAIAQGDIADHTPFYKLGYSPASSGSQTTLWSVGTEYVWPTVPMQMEAVSSDNTNDNVGGTGVLTMHLHYLDTNYVEQLEIITLTGTIPKLTVATNIYRVNSWHANTTGTGKKAAGNIDIRNLDHTTVYSRCNAGFTRSRNSCYTVPAGKTLYISDLTFAAGYSTSGKTVRMTLHATITPYELLASTNGLFFPIFEAMLMDNILSKSIAMVRKVVEKSDLKVSVVGETNAICTSEISGWIE